MESDYEVPEKSVGIDTLTNTLSRTWHARLTRLSEYISNRANHSSASLDELLDDLYKSQ